MIIKKRRTPELVVEELINPEWRKVFKHPLLAGIVNFPTTMGNQSTDAAELLSVASNCKRGHLTGTPLVDKVFMYITCFISWRMFGKSFLSDAEYAALARHLFGAVQRDKIDKEGAVPLAHRMAFVFDIPVLGARYKRAKSIAVPVDHIISAPKKRKLQRVKPKK